MNKENKSVALSSGRSGSGELSKVSVMRGSKHNAKWKVGGGKVEISSGDYSIEDLVAISTIQSSCERHVTCKGNLAE